MCVFNGCQPDMKTTSDFVLVINCGSSSLKFTVFPAGNDKPVISGLAECLGQPDSRLVIKRDGGKTASPLQGGGHAEALADVFRRLREDGLLDRVRAVGHRVVHGGERFKASALITPDVLAGIEACNVLAPLHNPVNVLGIRASIAGLPGIPQAAVFDTAFHTAMPPAAYTYAIPQKYYREYCVRRYGFHGTSCRYAAGEAIRMLGLDPASHGLVIAHLGNGASATAVLDGRSAGTTMGFTPLEGLVMGTRSGDIDAGAVAFIARTAGFGLDGIDTMLNKESGLLGLSELSGDYRTLEEASGQGHAGATLALDVFVHRLARHIGGLATSLRQFDALVFTGGIGENSARLRAMTLARLGVFGFRLDANANDAAILGRAGQITRDGGPAAVVVPANEESVIAMDTAVLAGLLQPERKCEAAA